MEIMMNIGKPQGLDAQIQKPLDRRGVLFGAATIAAAAATASAPAFAQTAACSGTQVGSVWWNELVAADPVTARAFYTKIMGWTAKIVSTEDNSRPPNAGEEEYTLFLQNGEEVAGLTKANAADPTGLRPGWIAYVQVASVDDAVTQTLMSGGKVLRFPVDVAKVGRIAVLEDASGTQTGIVTPAVNAAG
jgi:predicted enzyme related to lactoylglutathione lyase